MISSFLSGECDPTIDAVLCRMFKFAMSISYDASEHDASLLFSLTYCSSSSIILPSSRWLQNPRKTRSTMTEVCFFASQAKKNRCA